LRGNHPEHEALESELARLTKTKMNDIQYGLLDASVIFRNAV